jgi:uncharacterized protein YdhG (YjbR/CyaY superfamily)
VNRAEHKTRAEELLAEIEQTEREVNERGGIAAAVYERFAAERASTLAKAQVHATLALYPDEPESVEPWVEFA